MDIDTLTNTHEDDRGRSRLTRRNAGRSSAAFLDPAPLNLKFTYEETIESPNEKPHFHHNIVHHPHLHVYVS
jgi:hypothetical protein